MTYCLDGYDSFTFTHGPWTRRVFRRGEGPAVIVIDEMPGPSTPLSCGLQIASPMRDDGRFALVCMENPDDTFQGYTGFKAPQGCSASGANFLFGRLISRAPSSNGSALLRVMLKTNAAVRALAQLAFALRVDLPLR